MAEIKQLVVPNAQGTNITYDFDLPTDATPTVASLNTTQILINNSMGTNGQFLKTNGSTIFWGSDNNSCHSHDAGGGLVLTASGSNLPLSGTYTYKLALTSEAWGGSPVSDANKLYGVRVYSSKLGIYVPWTDMNVTSLANHYTPSGGSWIRPTSGTIYSNGSYYTITSVTKDTAGHITAATRQLLPSYNTCHSHSAGYGVSISGTGGTSGTVYLYGKPYVMDTIFIHAPGAPSKGSYTMSYAPGSYEFLCLDAGRNDESATSHLLPTCLVGLYNGSAKQFFVDGSTANYGKYTGIYFSGINSRYFYVAQTTGLTGLHIFGFRRS